ncbi:non-ribosomal peptide synthetase [Pseudonocardia sp. RS010]|uniref:non-ribosomal peptide synthetase n=1 Tax=Pseudonocardia sp. RS010 TaxID=3385979 RepID=UPI00399F5741
MLELGIRRRSRSRTWWSSTGTRRRAGGSAGTSGSTSCSRSAATGSGSTDGPGSSPSTAEVGLTYDELDARTNRLARYLRLHGTDAGDRVGLLFDDRVEAHVATLAKARPCRPEEASRRPGGRGRRAPRWCLHPRGRTCAALHAQLVDRRVSAFCTTPALLSTLEADLPALHVLVVSGEACPSSLVARWHRPGRRFDTAYVPGGATVAAAWAEAQPDEPVMIGAPLPTYAAVILDPDYPMALPHGETGEIGLAGLGLACGDLDPPGEAFVEDFLGIPGPVPPWEPQPGLAIDLAASPPAPAPAPSPPAPAGVRSTAGLAAALAGVLADVLTIEHVPVDRNVFDDLGADSMVVTRFCARLRRRDDLPSISIRDVYANPTIAGMAAAADGSTTTAPASSSAPSPASATRLPPAYSSGGDEGLTPPEGRSATLSTPPVDYRT